MFWNWLFRWKCNKFAKQKVAQNVAISLGYFIFSKDHNEPPKVTNWSQIAQSGHPGDNLCWNFGDLNQRWDVDRQFYYFNDEQIHII